MSFRRFFIFVGIVAVLSIAGWLRFAALGDRPIHFDEATGARILGERLASGRYIFDPEHFHGPLLSFVSAPVVRLRGESSWEELTKSNLRLGVAVLSLLTVAGALAIGRFGGRGDGLMAAAFVATCPLLAYYGRMYIHEPVFTACGLLALLALLGFLVRPGVRPAVGLGVGAGLMAATRETFVIMLFAWGLAVLAWPWPRADSMGEKLRMTWASHGRYLWIPLVLGLALIGMWYSDFGRHPSGVVDFVRTYFDYTVMPGHEKAPLYYLELLLWPRERGGIWWTEMGVLLLALHGYFRCPAGNTRAVCRFLVHAGAAYLAVFSVLAYKTPWLSCLGWLHVCLAAGMGSGEWIRARRGWRRVPVVAVVAAMLLWQGIQCHRAVFRFAADVRNPYAYVPTSKDTERMAVWLEDLAAQDPELKTDVLTVVGGAYWPLPWYLRGFDQVGYWKTLPDGAADRGLILLVSSGESPDTTALKDTHVFFPRGLREEVLIMVALRNDIWEGFGP